MLVAVTDLGTQKESAAFYGFGAMEDTTERYEVRLFELYQQSITEFKEYILRLDPSYSPSYVSAEDWPRQLSLAQFRAFLRAPVRDPDVRRSFVERLLLLETDEDRVELDRALRSILECCEKSRESGAVFYHDFPHPSVAGPRSQARGAAQSASDDAKKT